MTAEDDLTIYYWPFCVGANMNSDYCLIAGPDFLITEGRINFFRTKYFKLNDISPSPKILHIDQEGHHTGLSAVYAPMIATVLAQPQYDYAGRPLYCAVGFIVRDDHPDLETMQPILSQCDVEMTPILERFLTLDHPIDTPLATTRQAFSSRRKSRFDKNDTCS